MKNFYSSLKEVLTIPFYKVTLNKYEFIAVLIEHFFETPEEFKAKFPYIYENLMVMLNQNPLQLK